MKKITAIVIGLLSTTLTYATEKVDLEKLGIEIHIATMKMTDNSFCKNKEFTDSNFNDLKENCFEFEKVYIKPINIEQEITTENPQIYNKKIIEDIETGEKLKEELGYVYNGISFQTEIRNDEVILNIKNKQTTSFEKNVNIKSNNKEILSMPIMEENGEYIPLKLEKGIYKYHLFADKLIFVKIVESEYRNKKIL